MKRWKLGALSLMSAMIAAAAVVNVAPATAGGPEDGPPIGSEQLPVHRDETGATVAAAGDSFSAKAGPLCYRPQHPHGSGIASFIDNGRGVPGNDKSNDDYIEVLDACVDHHGVRAWAWLNGRLLPGSKYNGKGYRKTVYWDPFPSGNVKNGDNVGIKVCLVDGSGDNNHGRCPKPCGCATRKVYE